MKNNSIELLKNSKKIKLTNIDNKLTSIFSVSSSRNLSIHIEKNLEGPIRITGKLGEHNFSENVFSEKRLNPFWQSNFPNKNILNTIFDERLFINHLESVVTELIVADQILNIKERMDAMNEDLAAYIDSQKTGIFHMVIGAGIAVAAAYVVYCIYSDTSPAITQALENKEGDEKAQIMFGKEFIRIVDQSIDTLNIGIKNNNYAELELSKNEMKLQLKIFM